MTNDACSIVEIFEQPDVGIVMRDGCRLSARIWMPKHTEGAPVPAIVEHLPYRKRDGTIHRDELGHPYTAARGYACIRVDMRGNGESQGLMHDEYTEQELQDACDVIQWASEQPWCNGKVGMMGISWGGFNSLQVAALQPPALKAIITVCSSVDRFVDDIHYKGGCLLTENIGWAANMLSYSSRPPDPVLVGDSWLELWKQRLEHLPFLGSTWLRHQQRDAYWQHGSVCEDYTAIKAAVLSVGGWHDGYRNTISHLVTHLSCPVKGIVGPWIHKYPHYAKPDPAIGFLQESLRWWDRWLKNADTGVEDDPAYRAWVMDSVDPQRWLDHRPGRWVGEQHWPSPHITQQVFYVQSKTDTNDGVESSLSRTSSQCHLSINSQQTCGKAAGEYFPFTYGPELPDKQNSDDELSVYSDSDALTDALDIIGAPAISVSLQSDTPTGVLVVRLCDIRPDGTSALITYGMLNLAYRNTFEVPEKLTVGEVYDIRIPLDQIAYRIPAGHRLRLSLSTSYWPFIWPSPNDCTLTISSCCLELPVRADVPGSAVSFEEPETSTPWQTQEIRASGSTREVSYDDATGVTTTLIQNDFGDYLDQHHQLRSGSRVTEQFTIKAGDPLSATVDIQWEQTGGRDDWYWSSQASVHMHCDAGYFYTTATLTVLNNGKSLFERTFTDQIERIAV